MPDDTPLALRSFVLASASPARVQMLRNAALAFEVVASSIDEAAVIEAVATGGDALPPQDVAAVLARAKAENVSAGRPGVLVLGADQTLDLDGRLFVKPATMEEARRNLLDLRGRTHTLHSAAAIARDGATIWTHEESARMTMRDFGPEFLGRYLAAAGEGVLSSVGCYRLEGPGAHLFERIDGDFFTILGLPLVRVLAELRERGVVLA